MLDNGQRSPRKLLRALIGRILVPSPIAASRGLPLAFDGQCRSHWPSLWFDGLTEPMTVQAAEGAEVSPQILP